MSTPASAETKPPLPPLLKLALEAGPLVVFFVVNSRADIFAATAAFMVAVVIALSVNYWLERKVPIMPLVSGFFVLGFGALTLILNDELFIKLKPTIVNTLFAVILFGGLAFGKALLAPLLGSMLKMTDRGWSRLTLMWACFFVFLAILNEVIWRNFSTDFWAGFKLFGIMPITLVFSGLAIFLVRGEMLNDDQDTAKNGT
ncbi:MAG: septation protein A [Pseudomonadota bacterium]